MPRPYTGRSSTLVAEHVPEAVRAALGRVAKAEDRTVAATIRTILTEGLRARGELQ